MRRIAWRILGAIWTLWAVVVAIRLIPGDPVLAVLGGPASNASPEAVARARVEYGFDKPVLIQYFDFLGRVATGNLGDSYALKRPVSAIIAEQLPTTLILAFVALLLAWVIAVALAWWSVTGGQFAWRVASALEQINAVLPQFFLAIILIAVFAAGLGLPVAISSGWQGYILPAVALAIPSAGFLGQVIRERLADTLQQPFVTTALARGISRTRLFFTHVLRHAALPGVSTSAWVFGSLVSGAVVVETIFGRQGLGRTLLDAVVARDIPLVAGGLIAVAVIYVLLTLLTEVGEALVDPRTAARRKEAQRG
ncbi:ABC transporter permease [Neoactinobaculum massilliense]|uniref:ABC transporter permease n=1 Tax=Neoactinobaculum massilliense TaxID=2364794 RepID=UPI000F529AF9|nr:ABC transporter permease [Neoactinobaculum massilliense]